MAENRVYEHARIMDVTVTHPTTPTSGDPVRFRHRVGVALINENSVTGKTVVDFEGVYDLSVKGIDDAGNVAVAAGDDLYYTDADTPPISKKESAYYAGKALEAVSSGATATIRVALPGSGLGAPAPGRVRCFVATGGAAGDITVTGIAKGDRLIAVLEFATAAAIATLTDRTAEFDITAADTINNAGGTSTASDSLLVIYEDRT